MTRLDNVRGGEADGFAFDVFLSHSHEDSLLARNLATWLRQCGHSVWLDEEQLVPGSRFRTGLQQGLRESRHMVAVLTDSYINRPWTQRELDLFDLDADHLERRLLAIQLDNVLGTPLDQLFLVSQRILWHGELLDHEGLWKLHCGLTGQRPGSHMEWASSGRCLLEKSNLAPEMGPMARVESHRVIIEPSLLSGEPEFGALRSLANQVLTARNDGWRESFATFRERISEYPVGIASRELITLPWAAGLAELASIAALALFANDISTHVRGSTWLFVDLSCEAIANHLLLGYQLATNNEASEIWFSWAIWQQRWILLPDAAARAPISLRAHFGGLAMPAATLIHSFEDVEADYDYGVMITPWNHFHLGWLAARLGDMSASMSHLTSLCSSAVRGDPRTGRFLNRLSTWPIFAAHRNSEDFRTKVESARSTLGLIPLTELTLVQKRLVEVWSVVRR